MAGVAVETPATATARCTSPCRAGRPRWQHRSAQLRAPLRSPSPPGPLSHLQHAPAPARARRARAMSRTPCAAQARSRQGQVPERPRARRVAPPCPPCSPASPQRSRTPPPAYGGLARPREPLHRVHRAPPGHYISRPVPCIFPHRHTASPPHFTTLSSTARRAEQLPRSSGRPWSPRAHRTRGRRRPRPGRAASPLRSPLPSAPSPCTSHSPASFFPLDRAQERRQSLAGVRAPPRKREPAAVAARSVPEPRLHALELPRAAAPPPAP